MTIEKKAWLIVLFCAIAVFIIASCTEELQPELHPTEGTSVMFVPEGCKIGDIEVPENGIYIGESILIEQMRQQQREEQRRRQSRT